MMTRKVVLETAIADIAITIGRHAEARLSARENPTDMDRQEIFSHAGGVLQLKLEQLGVTNPAIIEEATAVMVDAYMLEVAKWSEGGGDA